MEIIIANKSHAIYAKIICETIADSANIRGTGIAKRTTDYIIQRMNNQNAVIALDDERFVGFCYIEKWSHGKFVANSGLIVHPDYRGKGIGKRVINHLISKFSSSSRYFFLKPFPLQMCGSSILKTKLDKDEVDFNSLNKDENISSFKLKQFYSSIGFKEFNNLMVLDTLNIDS